MIREAYDLQKIESYYFYSNYADNSTSSCRIIESIGISDRKIIMIGYLPVEPSYDMIIAFATHQK